MKTKTVALIRGWICVFLMVPVLIMAGQANAEIYRWQDSAGVIHYSNTPPPEQAKLLEVISTSQIPLVQDTEGTVYYLNVPGGALDKEMTMEQELEKIALPPEVVDELMREAAVEAQPSDEASSPAFEATSLTLRLTELEKALQREITKRLEWEQEYHTPQAYARELEIQNRTLQEALGQMETKIATLQKTVTVTDIHVSALQSPQHYLGQLSGKIDHVSARLAALETQEQPSSGVQAQLASLETQFSDFLPSARRTSRLVNELLEEREELQSVASAQSQQLQQQQTQIDLLRRELENFALLYREEAGPELTAGDRELPVGRIKVVPRKERRRIPEFSLSRYLRDLFTPADPGSANSSTL